MDKKILIFATILLCQSPALVAAASEAGMEYFGDDMQLTADQKSRLDEIFNDKHERYRVIREETQNRIRAVLTDKQLEKWTDLKKQDFEPRRGSFGGLE
jgi:hypothetical protein